MLKLGGEITSLKLVSCNSRGESEKSRSEITVQVAHDEVNKQSRNNIEASFC